MATVYSDASWTGNYTYTRVRVDYSGTSATAILLYTRTNTYSGATGSGSPAGFHFGGGWADMANRTFYGQQTDAEICRCGFSISMSGGSYSGYTDGQAGYLGFSGSVSIPAQYTAPSNPTISNVSTTTTTLTGTLNLSSWGNPSSGRFEYYFGTTSDTTSDYTLSPTSGYSSSKTASINKTGLTTNQHYYVRYRVWNQQLNNPSGLILGGAYITKPATSTNHTVDNVEMTSVRINWDIPADGGHYDKNYYYSLDNGSTWVLAKTYSGGSAGTGNCTISGLSPCTEYTAKFKVTTTAGTTNCPDFTIKTSGGLYGSVGGVTKKVTKLYGSVSGQTKEVKKLYASVGGVTKRVF